MKVAATRGFTLIELMVAVAIFAAIAAIAYGSIAALLSARERLESAETQLRSLQTALSTFERDIRSAVARPVREPYGDSRPALIGERGGVTLTRLRSGGLADASAQPQRVGYALDAQRWTRIVWPVTDAAPSTRPRTATLLDTVQGVSIRYLDTEGRWRDVWPAANVTAPAQLTALPRALDLRVRTSGFGELRRLIELPNPAPAPPVGSGPPPGLLPSP